MGAQLRSTPTQGNPLIDTCILSPLYINITDVVSGKKVVENKKPSHATIWVAKEFPPWQALVLNTLQQLHKENGGVLPENSVIAAKLKGEKSLGKYMKKVMPFVALLKVR